MGWPIWLSILSLCALGLMIVVLIAWLWRSELKARRQAHMAALLATRYRQERRGKVESKSQECGVTVAELIARNLAQGLAVRLNWEDESDERAHGQPTTEADEWPTGVLPRLER